MRSIEGKRTGVALDDTLDDRKGMSVGRRKVQ